MMKGKIEQYYWSNNCQKKKLPVSIVKLNMSIILHIKCQRKKKQLPLTSSALGRAMNFIATAITTLLYPSQPLAATDTMRTDGIVILVGKEAQVIWDLGQFTQEIAFQNIL